MILYHPKLNPDLLEFGILVPLLSERMQKTFDSLALSETDLSTIEAFKKDDLLLAHNEDFVERLFDDQLVIGEIEKCYELIDSSGNHNRYDPSISKRSLVELRDLLLHHGGATFKAAEIALLKNFSYFLGGGLHHAMSFGGRGFCLFNDIIITIKKLQAKKKIKKAIVIDVDAHKGDGTAELSKDDPSIQTLSIHMGDSWPLENPNDGGAWWTDSTIDIPIFEGEENEYLTRLEAGLKKLDTEVDLAIIVQGADPFEEDELPSTQKLKLSLDQMGRRDLLVYNFLKEREIPQAYVIGGGYGKSSHKVYQQFFKLIRGEGLVFQDENKS